MSGDFTVSSLLLSMLVVWTHPKQVISCWGLKRMDRLCPRPILPSLPAVCMKTAVETWLPLLALHQENFSYILLIILCVDKQKFEYDCCSKLWDSHLARMNWKNSLSGGGFALHSCPMLTSPCSPVCERVFSLTPVGLATSFLPLLPSNNCSHSVFEHKHTLLVVSLQLCVCVCVLSNLCESGEWNPSPFSAESCYDALLENGRISP